MFNAAFVVPSPMTREGRFDLSGHGVNAISAEIETTNLLGEIPERIGNATATSLAGATDVAFMTSSP